MNFQAVMGRLRESDRDLLMFLARKMASKRSGRKPIAA
jgi:hypothetical protein